MQTFTYHSFPADVVAVGAPITVCLTSHISHARCTLCSYMYSVLICVLCAHLHVLVRFQSIQRESKPSLLRPSPSASLCLPPTVLRYFSRNCTVFLPPTTSISPANCTVFLPPTTQYFSRQLPYPYRFSIPDHNSYHNTNANLSPFQPLS